MDSASDRAMHQYRHEGDAYRRIELITGVQRRRRWTVEEKSALVAASLQPGVNISELARRHGVNRGLLQTWRRAASVKAAECAMTFVPLLAEEVITPLADVAPRAVSASERSPEVAAPELGTIEIETGDLRVRFSGRVDTAALRMVLGRIGRRG